MMTLFWPTKLTLVTRFVCRRKLKGAGVPVPPTKSVKSLVLLNNSCLKGKKSSILIHFIRHITRGSRLRNCWLSIHGMPIILHCVSVLQLIFGRSNKVQSSFFQLLVLNPSSIYAQRLVSKINLPEHCKTLHRLRNSIYMLNQQNTCGWPCNQSAV